MSLDVRKVPLAELTDVVELRHRVRFARHSAEQNRVRRRSAEWALREIQQALDEGRRDDLAGILDERARRDSERSRTESPE